MALKTVQSETSNNTSTKDLFRGMSNGNTAPSHVSKLPIRSLLYPGANTKIYARVVSFFTQNSKHVDIGYRSDDRDQVRRQIEDMISRGIDGAVVDWYGTQRPEHAEVPVVFRKEAEGHPGFIFAISEDHGAIKKCKDAGNCDINGLLIEDLNYAYDHFENSPAYLHQDGRPVVFFFDVVGPDIDWNRIRASVKGNPLFINRNAHSFKSPESDGAFAWMDRNTSTDLPYLDDFYKKYFEARHSRQPIIFGSVFKGFDDRAASWGKGTVIPQNCGQTWLDTFAKINHYFSSSNPLDALEIVTWNDYEEGTEIETGIDDCVVVQPAISGDMLHWDITGNDKAVDHFTVYASNDGHKLTELGDIPEKTHEFKLSVASLIPGRYQLFVEAVGKPSIVNKMSPPVPWTKSASQ
jgi:hypothetical protein